MESGDILQTNEWIASQKDRDRERRRVRDRQRRQSMSQEERERHLARRRRNYQLRKQRASMMNSSCSGFEMDMIENENLEPVPVTEVGFQFNVSNGYGAISTTHNASETKSGDDQRFQMLASNKLGENGLQCGTNMATNGTCPVKCELTKSVRLVHVKRLARALHSTTELALDGSSGIEEEETNA